VRCVDTITTLNLPIWGLVFFLCAAETRLLFNESYHRLSIRLLKQGEPYYVSWPVATVLSQWKHYIPGQLYPHTRAIFASGAICAVTTCFKCVLSRTNIPKSHHWAYHWPNILPLPLAESWPITAPEITWYK
jgi:hypothetical protein